MSLTNLEGISATNYIHSMKDQLRDQIYARSKEAFAEGDAARDGVTTVAALQARQLRARELLLAGMGGLPPMDTPLNARVTGIIEEDGFRIEKVIFESRPKTYVTSNLYVPNGVAEPRGTVLFVCGHLMDAKHTAEYQIVCRHLVQAGLVVLAQDPIGQGERLGYYEKALGSSLGLASVSEHDYAGTQCLPLGDGAARYFLHDSMRAVDYLMSRPEVDPSRIGVTGNSGGGTQASLLMFADSRIAAAAPGTFIVNRRLYQEAGRVQDAEQIWKGFSAEGFDHEDILMAMCPKPVCVLAVTYDNFPIEATRETVERCRRFWKFAGKDTDIELVEDVSTHCYTPLLARAATRFFSRHLLGREVAVDSANVRAIEPKRLFCTVSGQVRGDIEEARAVYEENQDRLTALETLREAKPEEKRRQEALTWLREKVTMGRCPVPLNLRVYADINSADELIADLGFWWAQKGIFNEGLLFRNIFQRESILPVTIAVWDGGTTELRRHIRWLRQTCGAGRAVLVLNVSGVGCSEPNPVNGKRIHEVLGTMHKFSDELIWLDDSLCALRIYDVLRALEVLGTWPGLDISDVEVYTHGAQGIYAELAAALEPKLSSMEVHEAMEGFTDWVRARYYDTYGCRALMLPEILKYADLSDFRRWRKK